MPGVSKARKQAQNPFFHPQLLLRVCGELSDFWAGLEISYCFLHWKPLP